MAASAPFPEERDSRSAPAELQRAAGAAGQLRGYLPQRWPKAFDPKPLILDDGPYGPFRRSKRLTADGAIVAVATPGHTRDHLSVVVEDGDKTIFIAGDASYNEQAMLKGTIDGVSDNERPSGGDARRHPSVRRDAADGLSARPRS